ncbi:hypothetical protein [Micromonospora costi]|uniref:Uncharacterized protein n=1 Tax=Micromonospora costi TaxID=1530042 RepID=A0A3B0A5W2_9ACTN|nr:hypothetical protein [Micromonospora costi]RKN55912.1 hypothetical protein D7193_15080 [Micromonospora costi]
MDETTYAPQTEVEKATLRVIAADRYAREEDPNADAESEHADELLALACRDLVDAVNAGDPREWPIGWACGEVGTGWPNGTDGRPVHTQPCRFRPDHDGRHDWAIAEDAAEAAKPAGFIVLIRENDRWCDNWDGEVHPDQAAGSAALDVARSAGYEAVLVAAVPVAAEPTETAEQSTAIVHANLLRMGCAGLTEPAPEAVR